VLGCRVRIRASVRVRVSLGFGLGIGLECRVSFRVRVRVPGTNREVYNKILHAYCMFTSTHGNISWRIGTSILD